MIIMIGAESEGDESWLRKLSNTGYTYQDLSEIMTFFRHANDIHNGCEPPLPFQPVRPKIFLDSV